ncbi:hypothetical protein [Shewanella gelidii]|uniref:Phage shock protein B n=1 Tax=Shewanella gelidii TaxID=1642821 RepID=A0A917JW64_9GAMM|nr:hypothetical protein [Shewanella gelidii]MCL1098953.1 hypothetical protein [Shewanella gelidii]GGI90212.1 hypothetical protein GCM10009332_29490 [Shewanella gelidii]
MENDYVIFALVVLLVIGSTATELFKSYLKTKAQTRNKDNDSAVAELKQENNQLRERIQVLEKIVTEDSHQLKTEINRL